MSINLCHVTLNATPNSKCFSLCVSQLTDCLSLPSGSAGKGGKSTETAALGREESAKQRAGDWREGDKFLFFSPYLTISFKCFWEMYEWGKTALPKLILSPTVLLHPSRCPALPFLTLFHQNSFWFVQAHKASSLAPRHLMSPVPPSQFTNLTWSSRGPQKANKIDFPPSFPALPSSLCHLSFSCSQPEICPLAHFPNSLRSGFKSQRLGPGMPPLPAFKREASVCTHADKHTPTAL